MSKRLIVMIVVLGGAAAGVYYFTGANEPELTEATPPPANVPIWQQPLPAGTEPVEPEDVDIHVEAVRKNLGGQTALEFHLSEAHGYLVDGIEVSFWYRSKDEASGQWVDDSRPIQYFVKKRLDFGGTLVDSTVLKPVEFEHLGIDILKTTSENWGVRADRFMRAARRVD